MERLQADAVGRSRFLVFASEQEFTQVDGVLRCLESRGTDVPLKQTRKLDSELLRFLPALELVVRVRQHGDISARQTIASHRIVMDTVRASVLGVAVVFNRHALFRPVEIASWGIAGWLARDCP